MIILKAVAEVQFLFVFLLVHYLQSSFCLASAIVHFSQKNLQYQQLKLDLS